MDDLAYFPPGTQTFVGCLRSGLRVRWYERGPKAAGEVGPSKAEVVLCLHGFPELAVSWREQLAGLSDRYRVVAPDMRGYGGTDAPTRVRDYAIDILARDVVELIAALGVEQVHLVGHDWGGAIAWEVAQRYPERLLSLSVINCPPYQLLMRELLKRPDQLRRSWYFFFFQLPRVPEWRMRRDPELVAKAMLANAYNKQAFTPERLEPYIRQARERTMAGVNYYRAAIRHVPTGLILGLRPIQVPTRLIWGLRDPALGPWFAEPRRYESWVRHFDRVVLEDVGHFPAQEAPDAVNAALREHFEPKGLKTDGREAARVAGPHA